MVASARSVTIEAAAGPLGVGCRRHQGSVHRRPNARRTPPSHTCGRFFGPFAILLVRSVKKKPRQLCLIAGWILFMQMLDMYLVVLPALHGTGVHLSLWDFVALIGIGSTLAFVYLRIVGKASLFPVRDPRLVESLRLTN